MESPMAFSERLKEGYLPTFLAASILLILALKFLSKKKNRVKENLNLPPSPPKLPIIGNLHQLGSMPHLSLLQLARKYGPIIHLQLGEVPTVVVSSARTAKEVMKTHDLELASRPQIFSAKHLFYNCTDIAFAPYSAYWRHIRKISILELLSMKQVQSYSYIRKEEVARLVSRIAESYPSPTDLSMMLGLYANDVICRAALGTDYSQGDAYIRHGIQTMLEEYQALLGGFHLGDFFPSMEFIQTLTGLKSRLQNTFHRFDRLFDQVIEEHLSPNREKDDQHKDLVDVLLGIQKNGDMEMPLTMDNLKAIILDMFAAGTDTSFITLDWGMTELIRNPEVLKKAQAEIRGVVGERTVLLESDLNHFPYTKAVVKEILRLHPPAPVLLPRESMKDVTIHGYNIPFGAGRRSCPAIAFGTATVEIALAQLLHSFDWELPPGVQAKDLDMKEAFGITMHRISHLIVVAKPHFQQLKS